MARKTKWWQFSEIVAFGSSKTSLSPPVTGRLLAFTVFQPWWFSSLSQYSKEGDENRQNPNDTKLTIVTEIQLFFLKKFSLDCCKTLDIFRILKKLILTLLIFSLLFLRRNKYLEVLTPLFISKKLFFPEKKSKVHSPIEKALGKRLSQVLWSATIYLRHIFRNMNIRFIKKIKSIKIWNKVNKQTDTWRNKNNRSDVQIVAQLLMTWHHQDFVRN